MATAPKPGGNNDKQALTRARNNVRNAITATRRIIDEIERMRGRTGRPDYGKLERLVAGLSTNLATTSTSLDEMENIRIGYKSSTPAPDADDALIDRLDELQRQIDELRSCQHKSTK